MTDVTVSGSYRACLVCNAPMLQPFPDGWTLDVIKEGPVTGPISAWMTPHAEQCDAPTPNPQPGMAVRVPGAYVAATVVSPAPAYADPDGRVCVAPPGTRPDDRGKYKLIGEVADPGVVWAWAATDLRAGQLVQWAEGAGPRWVKPTVAYDIDGEAMP